MADLKDDIEKYLRGELSPEARHALERKALDDPFLSDALDGAASVSPAELTADLKTLEDSLKDRIGQRKVKVVPMWSWVARIAAGVMLVAIATFVVVQVFRGDSNQGELAESKKAPAHKPIVKDSIATPEGAPAEAKPGEDSAADRQRMLSLAEQEKSEPADRAKEEPTAAAPAQPRPAEAATESTSDADDLGPADKPVTIAEIEADEVVEEKVMPASPAAGFSYDTKAKKAAGEQAAATSRSKDIA